MNKFYILKYPSISKVAFYNSNLAFLESHNHAASVEKIVIHLVVPPQMKRQQFASVQ